MKIFNSKILTSSILFIFLFPHLFDEIELLNNFFIILQLIIFIILFIKFNVKNTSNILYFILLFRITLLIPTLIFNNSIYSWFSTSFKLLSICYISDIALKINCRNYLNCLIKVLFIQLFFNLITYNFDYSKIFIVQSDVHLLGIRTRFSDVIFPFIAILLLNKNINNINKNKFYFYYLVAVLNIFIAWIGTGITGLIIFNLFYYYLKDKPKQINFFSLNTLALIAFIINIAIIFFRIQNIFSFFITGILKKSITFTGRTYIWDVAIQKISNSIWIGHGVTSTGKFVNLWGEYRMAHSQLLQTLYEGGIISVISFALIVVFCSKKIKKNQTNTLMLPITVMLFALFIMMLTERFLNYPYIYILFIIIYNSKKIYLEGKKHGFNFNNSTNV